jgi:hypothetical protein
MKDTKTPPQAQSIPPETLAFFNRRLDSLVRLVRMRYNDGYYSKRAAVETVLDLLKCTHREHGFCYQILKQQWRKELVK